jgi:diguanylate cyclase (GGDEF)-like protein/PAS domain S-box-containing protein
MQAPHIFASNQANRRILDWEPTSMMTLLLGSIALLYAGWVLLGGSQGQTSDGRHLLALLTFLVVAGGSVLLAGRARRIPTLERRARRAWTLLWLALLANWLGGTLYTVADDVFGATPLAVLANTAFGAFYPLMLLALASFATVPRTWQDRCKLVLDAAMIVIPGAMMLWAMLPRPALPDNMLFSGSAMLPIVSPFGDLAILAGLAVILLQRETGACDRALRILALGDVVYVIGDVMFARRIAVGSYQNGMLPDVCWVAASWLFALAAQERWLASTTARATAPAASEPGLLRRPGPFTFSTVPYAGVAGGYALLLIVAVESSQASMVALIAGAVVLTICVVTRQVLTLRENASLLAEQARQQGEARFSSLVRHLHDVVAIVDADSVVQYISPSVQRLLGQSPAGLQGAQALTLFVPGDAPAARALLVDALASPHETVVTDLRLLHVDGSRRNCEVQATNLLHDGGVQGIVLTCHDVTERRAFEQELSTLAVQDRLTGLPNRTLLLDRVGLAVARAGRRHGQVAVLFVDLDNFKLVNDSLGLQAGDMLLVQVAERIQACLRAEDTLGRMGGDELAILIEDLGSESDATAVAERILAALQVPFVVNDQPLFVAASIGIALNGPMTDEPTSLLRDADLAMFQAKSRGKGCWALFNPELNAAAVERLELETALRGVLERDELYVAYQPVVDLATGEVREVEALLRWQSPEFGLIPPGRFVPVAEETGLILQIGTWTLREACQQVVRWNSERTGDPLVVAVNVSGRQLQEPSLVSTVATVLAETGLDAACLKLELTESVVMDDAEATIEMLGQLKALGVQLAIDDFGTGYSSLSYLKRFPIDVLKVDRSFVDGLGTSQQDAALVQGIIALAQSLGLTVTGEGVETVEQAAYLKRLGCDLAQGYLYSRPLPAAGLEALLAEGAGSLVLGAGDDLPSASSTHRQTVAQSRSLVTPNR